MAKSRWVRLLPALQLRRIFLNIGNSHPASIVANVKWNPIVGILIF
jgi:hypothetical protein